MSVAVLKRATVVPAPPGTRRQGRVVAFGHLHEILGYVGHERAAVYASANQAAIAGRAGSPPMTASTAISWMHLRTRTPSRRAASPPSSGQRTPPFERVLPPT